MLKRISVTISPGAFTNPRALAGSRGTRRVNRGLRFHMGILRVATIRSEEAIIPEHFLGRSSGMSKGPEAPSQMALD